MGNRAVITTAPFGLDNVGIYVHWNGGRESIEAFLAVARELDMLRPNDSCYGLARLTQIIGNYFGGGLSLGIGKVRELDYNNGDNGTYLIDGDWEIVGREFHGEDGRIDTEYRDAIKLECLEKMRAAGYKVLTPAKQ